MSCDGCVFSSEATSFEMEVFSWMEWMLCEMCHPVHSNPLDVYPNFSILPIHSLDVNQMSHLV